MPEVASDRGLQHPRLQAARAGTPVELELGCGRERRRPGAVGIDLLDYPEVDVVADVLTVLESLPDSSVTRVSSHHFMEHVDDLDRLVVELARVLVPGGELQATVPHFSNPYFYSDPTHRSAFGLYTFSYYAKSGFRRQVPRYLGDLGLVLESAYLKFHAGRPYYFRHGSAKSIEAFVNSSSRRQEKYEQRWAYLFPCYEISYLLTRSA